MTRGLCSWLQSGKEIRQEGRRAGNGGRWCGESSAGAQCTSGLTPVGCEEHTLSRSLPSHRLRRVRIALDGSDLAAERFEGPSVYAGELLPRLTSLLTRRGHEAVTYVPGPVRSASVAGSLRVIPGSPYWTQRTLSRALFRDRPDVLFLPIQMLPLARPRTLATVAVVHDLEFLRSPRTYTTMNRVLLRLFTRHAVRNATHLIAVSQYTKDDVARVYGRNPQDITVVHHGVDQARVQIPDSRFLTADAEVRARYHLPEQFLLFVGSLQPRKNIAGLLAAYEQFVTMPRVPTRISDSRGWVSQHPAPIPHLVLVSGGGWKEAPILARIRRSPVRDRILLLRRLTRDDLVALYRAAEVFVLPSFSEGFGMPVLEAMAAGTPVVASNTSSLPEIAGDAALLVDPSSPEAIAAAMRRVLADEALRRQLVARGLQRAAQFTWERTAVQTADVIESAARPATARDDGRLRLYVKT